MSNHKSVHVTSFTTKYNGLSRELVNDVGVSSKLFHPSENEINIDKAGVRPYKALWDTGATNCVITQKIVDELNLKPTGMTKVNTASHSNVDAEIYLVSIFLPNKICIPNVRVTKGNLTKHDMLIGMDVINQGDFAVTHNSGKTSFSFRMPSIEEIDFTKRLSPSKTAKVVGRNDPCPCGSEKKYKKCCGRPTA